MVGVTSVVPELDTEPMPLFIETVVAPPTLQISAAVCPDEIVPGEIVNNVIVGSADDWVTVTVAEVITLPLELVAVKVYVVVAEGVTVRIPEAGTAPMPLLIEMALAPETFHCKVEDCPAIIVPGLALKDNIVGNPEGGATTTMADCVVKP